MSNDEIVEIRERLLKVEMKLEELNKRVDNMANYLKELYKYLQQTGSKFY
ncbi:MAG: hypothetical protein QXI91_01610 [Candidatus Bathyarchaeia archaeon]